jgi:hypothetical protein
LGQTSYNQKNLPARLEELILTVSTSCILFRGIFSSGVYPKSLKTIKSPGGVQEPQKARVEEIQP